MNKFQEIPVSEVHTGNFVVFEYSCGFVEFAFICESVESVISCEFVEFEFLGLFGGSVDVLGLTAEQVQGAAV